MNNNLFNKEKQKLLEGIANNFQWDKAYINGIFNDSNFDTNKIILQNLKFNMGRNLLFIAIVTDTSRTKNTCCLNISCINF